jgi:hypothetical protein
MREGRAVQLMGRVHHLARERRLSIIVSGPGAEGFFDAEASAAIVRASKLPARERGKNG